MNIQSEIDKRKTRKPLLIISLFSMAMMFVAMTSGYFVSKTTKSWVAFDLPPIFIVSTVIIIVSSFTLHIAVKAAREEAFAKVTKMIGLTAFLGLAFLVTQLYAWSVLVSMGQFFAGSNQASSYVYVITGLHLAHLLAGLILMGIMLNKAKKQLYNKETAHNLSLGATFWHFLGGLWLYLYLFLIIVG